MASPVVEWQNYEGFYNLREITAEIKVIAGKLTVAFPDVPPGFEVILIPLEDSHTFRMQGGPTDGATAVFQTDGTGAVTAVEVGGEYVLTRIDAPPESDGPTGQGLRAPALVLDGEKEAAFAGLLNEILERRHGRFIDYQLPYPKYEFLQYVAMQDAVIFHGSANPDIDEFRTRRTSIELHDKGERGNLQAVYGTHDGLWPIFFAVVDRQKITGSIRNGVAYYTNAAGEQIAVYNFSINREWVDKKPWREGTMYLLPRETFRRLPATREGGLANEWASEVPVKPLARLALAPEDFPFLDQIGGHDDSELVRLGELSKVVVTAVTQADPLPAGYALKLNWTEALQPQVMDYIELLRQFMPTAQLALRFEPEDEVWFDMQGPPAFQQVLKDRLQKQLP